MTKQLETIKALYQEFLGETPDFDNIKKFISGPQHPRNPTLFQYINRDFLPTLTLYAKELIPKNPKYNVLHEFIYWISHFTPQNILEEVVHFKKRLDLFNALVLNENNLMELKDENSIFLRGFSQESSHLFSQKIKSIDIFYLFGIIKTNSLLTNEINDLGEKVKIQYEKFRHSFDDLSADISSLHNKGWLLQRSEQHRQDLRVKIELFLLQAQILKSEIKNYLDEHPSDSSIIDKMEKLDLELQTFQTGLNIISWHVATEEGRNHDLQWLQKTFIIKPKVENHRLQNALVPKEIEWINTQYNPSSYPSSFFPPFLKKLSPQEKREQMITQLTSYIDTRNKEWDFHYNFLGIMTLIYFIKDKLTGSNHFNIQQKDIKIKAAQKLKTFLQTGTVIEEFTIFEIEALKNRRLGKIVGNNPSTLIAEIQLEEKQKIERQVSMYQLYSDIKIDFDRLDSPQINNQQLRDNMRLRDTYSHIDSLFIGLEIYFRNSGFLETSEQHRQDLRAQIETILFYIDVLKTDMFIENESDSSLLEKLSLLKEKLKILCWHVGTPEGRLQNLIRLKESKDIEDIDLHVLQNPLTPKSKEQVEAAINLDINAEFVFEA